MWSAVTFGSAPPSRDSPRNADHLIERYHVAQIRKIRPDAVNHFQQLSATKLGLGQNAARFRLAQHVSELLIGGGGIRSHQDHAGEGRTEFYEHPLGAIRSTDG
jgi:hypothetical protein